MVASVPLNLKFELEHIRYKVQNYKILIVYVCTYFFCISVNYRHEGRPGAAAEAPRAALAPGRVLTRSTRAAACRRRSAAQAVLERHPRDNPTRLPHRPHCWYENNIFKSHENCKNINAHLK